MDTLIRVAQFILSLSILVVLHEFGHYITARMFKTRVEKFYLFFDFLFPFPNLLNFALFKKKVGDTEYGLGWFPLGGYVKIAGMIDESMDEEFLKSEPQPWEFRSKKAWQRLIIMLGGITMNVILAWVIYSLMLYYWGESRFPVENVKYGFAADSTAQSFGLMDGDKIISYNGGKKFKNADKVGLEMLINNAKTLEIDRAGEKKTLTIPKSVYKDILANKGDGFMVPLIPCVVDSVKPESPLAKAGGKKGDRIIQLDSIHTEYYQQFKKELKNFKGTSTSVLVERADGNKKDTMRLDVAVPDSAILGFYVENDPGKIFTIDEIHYGFFESFPMGAKKTYEQFIGYTKQIRLIFDPELKGYKQVGSFFTIGQQFSARWDWQRFWMLTAFLSIALAFVNLLPIPGLDGGHALFTLVEMVTGRAPNEKFLERAQMVGMIIIFGLMIFALSNDVLRIFFGRH